MSKPSQPVSGFVPIGDVADGLSLPNGRALTPVAPQALHHFTTLHQVNQLIEASEADADLGFMARLLALCSLPRTNPKNRLQYVRRNGPYTLGMSAGINNKLPYGNIPRLLLAWVCSEAVRTQRRELVLGRSLYEFMRKLGMDDRSGGANAERTRLKNQMRRLFRCTVSLVYEDAQRDASVTSPIADRTEFWWSERQPDAPVLWNSTIRLGEAFFNEIIAHPIPLDLNTLKALKRSPLGLDLYFWLVYRTFTLKRPLRLSWKQLYQQFGADAEKEGNKSKVNHFRANCLRELKKINRAWPDLHYQTVTGALVLLPSPPRIPPAQLRLHRGVGQPPARIRREVGPERGVRPRGVPIPPGRSTNAAPLAAQRPDRRFPQKSVILEVFHRLNRGTTYGRPIG